MKDLNPDDRYSNYSRTSTPKKTPKIFRSQPWDKETGNSEFESSLETVIVQSPILNKVQFWPPIVHTKTPAVISGKMIQGPAPSRYLSKV